MLITRFRFIVGALVVLTLLTSMTGCLLKPGNNDSSASPVTTFPGDTSGRAVTGPEVEFRVVTGGTVRFSHDRHVEKFGLTCATCHPEPWPMKAEYGLHTMAQMAEGMSCGQCHTGKEGEGFSTTSTNNCSRCHTASHEHLNPSLVGEGECRICHSAVVDEYVKDTRPSHSFDWANYRQTASCGECHIHESVFGKSTGMAAAVGTPHSITCQTCHFTNESEQKQAGVAAPYRLRKGSRELCATCHHVRNNYDPEFPLKAGYRTGDISNVAIPLYLMNLPSVGSNISLLATTTANATIDAAYASMSQQLSRYIHYSSQHEVFLGAEAQMAVAFTHDMNGQSLIYTETNHKQFASACATCHMGRDPEKGNWGHTFDSSGSCVQCHSNMTTSTYQDEIYTLLNTLSSELDVDKSGAAQWIDRTPAGRADHTAADIDPRLTSGDKLALIGAAWNHSLIYGDRSKGIHNYKWTKSLLENSIAVVRQIKAARNISDW